eukprot:CAMPEP_0201510566 /NCGR_PEP_ID=MMETSP0161_2-20130828/3200_1 /ASSEMBLY_ACC=CAM_ASM_000251 /TAXON_ID=180227 /ORGANISM="Neoparamoeba aestuarina, Strain SoJaBio B1-5/56/2" /LENGTH=192 /DNA_ID=CAMNT_0047905755 /DNA_START=82 /DNA_END=657 /DNA_ORIENTATION=-
MTWEWRCFKRLDKQPPTATEKTKERTDIYVWCGSDALGLKARGRSLEDGRLELKERVAFDETGDEDNQGGGAERWSKRSLTKREKEEDGVFKTALQNGERFKVSKWRSHNFLGWTVKEEAIVCVEGANQQISWWSSMSFEGGNLHEIRKCVKLWEEEDGKDVFYGGYPAWIGHLVSLSSSSPSPSSASSSSS